MPDAAPLLQFPLPKSMPAMKPLMRAPEEIFAETFPLISTEPLIVKDPSHVPLRLPDKSTLSPQFPEFEPIQFRLQFPAKRDIVGLDFDPVWLLKPTISNWAYVIEGDVAGEVVVVEVVKVAVLNTRLELVSRH